MSSNPTKPKANRSYSVLLLSFTHWRDQGSNFVHISICFLWVATSCIIMCIFSPFLELFVHFKTLDFFIKCSLEVIFNVIYVSQAVLTFFTGKFDVIPVLKFHFIPTTSSTARQWMTLLVCVSRKQNLKYVRTYSCTNICFTHPPATRSSNSDNQIAMLCISDIMISETDVYRK